MKGRVSKIGVVFHKDGFGTLCIRIPFPAVFPGHALSQVLELDS